MAKIRTDFVTNSSSSSFLVLGKNIDWAGLEYVDLEKEEIYLFSEYKLSDGADFFRFTQEMYNHTVQHGGESAFPRWSTPDFIKVFYQFSGEEGEDLTLNLGKLVEQAKPHNINEVDIYTFDKDYHCTKDLDDFDRRYCEN